VLQVDCTVEYLVLCDPVYTEPGVGRYYPLILTSCFDVEHLESDGTRGLSKVDETSPIVWLQVPQRWASDADGRPKQLSEVGQRKYVTLSYRGTPLDHDQYGYAWSGCSGEAVWLIHPSAWLPGPSGDVPEDYWTRASYRLCIAVPKGWRVLSPGFEPLHVTETSNHTEYMFESLGSPGVGPIPGGWVAGSYLEPLAGTSSGIGYTVWPLRGYAEEAQAMFSELGQVIQFCSQTLGDMPSGAITAIQVPPQMGSALVFKGAMTLIASARPLRHYPPKVWAHEVVHLAAPNFREGLVDLLALEYVRQYHPHAVPECLGLRRERFMAALGRHGDRAIVEAREAGWDDLPDPVAFWYAKPLLVWNMFRGLFGREATMAVVHELQRETAELGSGVTADSDWFSLVEQSMNRVCGTAGGVFYRRWFTEAFPLDFAIERASCRQLPGDDTTDERGWLLQLTLRDNHAQAVPPGRDTVPWVEVAVLYGGGQGPEQRDIHRIPMTQDVVTTELLCTQEPQAVELDPNRFLLDYDLTNNYQPVLPVSAVGPRMMAIILCVALLLTVLRLWLLRRPKRVPPPPGAGRSR